MGSGAWLLKQHGVLGLPGGRTRIEDDAFFGGAYRGRVIEVHSNQTGQESDDAMTRLVALEHRGDTDIVIHVNKLKEGWDVTNLYTIVPLRASASDILTEQTLGRGLRLPYGARTGEPAVDTLTVIAHDRFDEVIKATKAPGSLVTKSLTIGAGGDVSAAKSVPVSAPTRFEAALTGDWPTGDTAPAGAVAEAPAPIYTTASERTIAKQAFDVIRERYEGTSGGVAALRTPEVRRAIAADIMRHRAQAAAQAAATQPQGTLEIEAPTEPDIAQIEAVVEAVTEAVAANVIEIPEIVVLPSREVNFWFDDCDMGDLSAVRHQPMSDQILIRNLRDETRRTLARGETGAREDRVENYIVRHLVDYPEVDYDAHADLLYKLAGQIVTHLRTYLPDAEAVENVALAHGRDLARLAFARLKAHQRQTPAEYRAKLVRQYRALQPQQFAITADRQRPLDQPAAPLSATPSFVFYGGRRSPYAWHKFDSDAERRFACLIDATTTVRSWLKPGRGQFNIEYQGGKAYEPDFVVETDAEKLIVEIKAYNELGDVVVQEKARAARAWVDQANGFASETGAKSWRYALVADTDITESATLSGLLALGR